MRRIIVLAVAITGAVAVPHAVAQPRERVTVSINGAYQTTKNPFADRFEFEVDRETGSTETEYPVGAGLVIDGSVAFRLWKNFGAGIAVSHFTRDDVAATDSRVPHPFHFEMHREVAGDVPVNRTERGVHVQAVYRVALRPAITLALFGGPSFMHAEQDIVTAIEYDQSFPFDTATFRRGVTGAAKGSAVGFNAGADVAWMFSRHLGVGALARFAKASVELDVPGGRTKTVDAGGFSGGGGLRIVF